jgi:hypothetical protein
VGEVRFFFGVPSAARQGEPPDVGDDTPIGLVYLVQAEHLVEARQGLAGLGKEDNARRRAVQAVGHADKDVAGLVVAFLDEALKRLAERFVAALVALNDFVAGLGDGYDVIIFVNDLHGNKTVILRFRAAERAKYMHTSHISFTLSCCFLSDYIFIPPST